MSCQEPVNTLNRLLKNTNCLSLAVLPRMGRHVEIADRQVSRTFTAQRHAEVETIVQDEIIVLDVGPELFQGCRAIERGSDEAAVFQYGSDERAPGQCSRRIPIRVDPADDAAIKTSFFVLCKHEVCRGVLKGGQPMFKERGAECVVVSEEHDKLAASSFYARTPVGVHPDIAWLSEIVNASISERLHDGGRIVGTAVVGDDEFEIRNGLRESAFDGEFQAPGTRVRRNQYTDTRHYSVFFRQWST